IIYACRFEINIIVNVIFPIEFIWDFNHCVYNIRDRS
ncbi:MAG: hypothetical protein Hyperionvirus18_1, partial [Hyperionvirus sp.]